jgi:hypothetical protein
LQPRSPFPAWHTAALRCSEAAPRSPRPAPCRMTSGKRRLWVVFDARLNRPRDVGAERLGNDVRQKSIPAVTPAPVTNRPSTTVREFTGTAPSRGHAHRRQCVVARTPRSSPRRRHKRAGADRGREAAVCETPRSQLRIRSSVSRSTPRPPV